MCFQIVIPTVLEESGKVWVVSAHPGYLVKKDKCPFLFGEAFAESLKSLHPGRWKALRPALRLRHEAFAEISQLVGVRLTLSRPQSLNHDEAQSFSACKLLEKGRFPNATPSTARDQRRGRLFKQFSERPQFLFSA